MTEYRLCYNEAPHRKPWWTVERSYTETMGSLWWKREVTVWRPLGRYRPGLGFGLSVDIRLDPYEFPSRDVALAHLTESQRPRVHRCEAPLVL